MMNKIEVEIQQKNLSYPIYMDSNPISELKDKILKDYKYTKFLAVISEKVYKLYKKDSIIRYIIPHKIIIHFD